MKLTCGFEMLAAQAAKRSVNVHDPAKLSDPKFRFFIEKLQENGYFQGELEGSKNYNFLLDQAKQFYATSDDNDDSFRFSSKVLELSQNYRHDPSEDVDEDDGAPAKTIPDRVKFLKKAIEHSRHFVSMVAHPSWQIASMKIVAYAVKVVQVDQETLLPLIHQTWQPLKLLFESDNIFVVSEAFSVLRIFAAVAKDFIHRRTVDEAFPGVMRCLHRIKSVVQDRNFRNTTLGRQSRHLLAEIVGGLWQFMDDLNLRESETELIIDEMIEFVELSKSKPKMFEAQNFQPVRTMDDDILWLKLMYRRNVQV